MTHHGKATAKENKNGSSKTSSKEVQLIGEFNSDRLKQRSKIHEPTPT